MQKCNCKVVIKPTSEENVPWGQIEYCSVHKAALEFIQQLAHRKTAFEVGDKKYSAAYGWELDRLVLKARELLYDPHPSIQS
jgi:hypothetical protein